MSVKGAARDILRTVWACIALTISAAGILVSGLIGITLLPIALVVTLFWVGILMISLFGFVASSEMLLSKSSERREIRVSRSLHRIFRTYATTSKNNGNGCKNSERQA